MRSPGRGPLVVVAGLVVVAVGGGAGLGLALRPGSPLPWELDRGHLPPASTSGQPTQVAGLALRCDGAMESVQLDYGAVVGEKDPYVAAGALVGMAFVSADDLAGAEWVDLDRSWAALVVRDAVGVPPRTTVTLESRPGGRWLAWTAERCVPEPMG